jgi:hypothetical protein
MFRFWAGATAGVFVCSFAVSGVSAEGLGSTIAPPASSQVSIATVFANVNFSSRNGPADLEDRAAEIGLARAGESAGRSQSLAYVDLVSSSPFSSGWSPMSSVINATSPPPAPRLSGLGIGVDTYFRVIESLSKRGMNGSLTGGEFATPMRGSAAAQTMW